MNKAIHISLIVPVYNASGYLNQCTETMLRQGFPRLEILLVDDGSTDGSGEICDRIAAEHPDRVRVIHKENGGVSSARNAGLDAARGEYIGFMDADDGAVPKMYEKLAAAAERYGADVVLGGYFRVDENGVRTPVSLGRDGDLGPSGRQIACAMAYWGGTFDGKPNPMLYGSVWPNLYRADVIRAHGIRFPVGITIGEDTLFNIDFLTRCGTVAAVDEPLYLYNVANTSATRRQNPKLWDCYKRLVAESYERLRDGCPETQQPELERNMHQQTLHFAIGIVEEQFLPFYSGSELRRKIRELCRDRQLTESASFIALYGTSLKKRLQAALFRANAALLLEKWLKK